MKKILSVGLLVTFTFAQAAQIDCSTPVFVDLERVGYKEEAVFPNPPKIVQFSPWELKQPRSFCGVTYAAKGNTLSVKVAKLGYFGFLTTIGRPESRIELNGLTTRPGKTGGVQIEVKVDRYYTTFNAQALVPADLTKTAVLAARVDGGKLQPMYWPGMGYTTIEFPKTTKVLDFYLKTNEPSNWQRITLNLQRPELTIYRKFAFPQK